MRSSPKATMRSSYHPCRTAARIELARNGGFPCIRPVLKHADLFFGTVPGNHCEWAARPKLCSGWVRPSKDKSRGVFLTSSGPRPACASRFSTAPFFSRNFRLPDEAKALVIRDMPRQILPTLHGAGAGSSAVVPLKKGVSCCKRPLP